MAGAVATVKGGFFEVQGLTSLTQIDGRNAARRNAARALARKSEMVLRAKMAALNGVVAGSTASKTLGRIEANSELGGARTVETETLVNAATVAGDVTAIAADVLAYSTKTTFGASPVANLDGNPLGTR